MCEKWFHEFFFLPDQNGTVETQEPLYNGSRQSSSRYSDNHPLIGSSNEGSTSVLVNPFADVQLLPVPSQQPSSSVTSSPLHNLNLKPEHRFSSLRGFSQQLMSSQNHYSPASKLFTNRYVMYVRFELLFIIFFTWNQCFPLNCTTTGQIVRELPKWETLPNKLNIWGSYSNTKIVLLPVEALLLPEVQLIPTLDPQEVPIVLPQVHNFFGRKFKILVKLSVQKKDVKSLYLKKIHEFSIFFQVCLNNYNNKYKSETWKVFPSVFPIPMTIFWPRSKILQQPVWWMWKKIMEACLIEAVPNKGKCKRRKKKEIHFLFLLSSMAVIFNFVFSSYISLFIFNPPFFTAYTYFTQLLYKTKEITYILWEEIFQYIL